MTDPCRWERWRTAESRGVERSLLRLGFEQADAYRYNPASIRVRVVDSRFEGITHAERRAMVWPAIAALPATLQSDIQRLVLLSPAEYEQAKAISRPEVVWNFEFDHPLGVL